MIKIILLCILLLIPGCTLPQEYKKDDLILATTTSMRDSGLLGVIIPIFNERYNVEVKVVAVGTGAALRFGENGDADLLIVHAPDKEVSFIEQGHGKSRITFAWNRFILIGPIDISNNNNISTAFNIAINSCFISRGDESGTHIKEQEIWQQTNLELVEDDLGIHPISDDFISIGNGMSVALNMADELNCFTLSDAGTYYHQKQTIDLIPSTFNDSITINPYSIIQLSQTKKSDLADKFEKFLLSEEIQLLISEYTINENSLFVAGQPNQVPSSNAGSA
jgi:tungstate transport system substrate-binding protein